MAIGGVGFLNQINQTNNAANTSLRRISSGVQNPSAAYSPSAYSISARMNSKIGTLSQSRSNTQTANAMLNVASGGVSSTVDALTSLKEKILQAANGTNQASDVATINKSVQQTISTINDNANVEFNGMKLLDGSRSVTVAGDNGYKTIQLGNMSAQGLGLADSDGKSTLDLSSPEGIANAIETVDTALNSALDLATDIGATQQNLNASDANYATSIASMTDAYSTEDDTDIAAEITKLKSAETQNQMALFAQKMFMHNNASVLSLLQ